MQTLSFYNFRLFLVLFITTLTGCAMFGIRSSYEASNYEVIEAFDNIEIRTYPERLVAEVSGLKDESASFWALFKYISGENITNQKIEQTNFEKVLVQGQKGEKISMTVPVEVLKDSEIKMRFFLPEKFNLQNTPQPTNSKIRIMEIPKSTFAVIRFSGFSSDSKIKYYEKELSEKLASSKADNKWYTIGQPSFLGYDSPFTIPFFRRNEVIIPVQK